MKTFRLVIETTVNAPVEHVYAVLNDLLRYPKFFRYMHDLKILEQRDNVVLAEITEDLFGMKVIKVLTKFTFKPLSKVVIEQIGGPFKKAIGWFELERQNDRETKVIHGAEISVGGLWGEIGLMLLSKGIAKARMIEELKAVKKEAEKLTSTKQVKS